MMQSVTVLARVLSVLVRRRKATALMAVLVSAGSLNDMVAERRISESLESELSSLLSIQPLLSSHDRASFAEVTGLGEAVICALRLARGDKSWVF